MGGGGLGWKLRQIMLTGRFYYLATWTEGLSCYEVVNSVGGSEWCTIRAFKTHPIELPHLMQPKWLHSIGIPQSIT